MALAGIVAAYAVYHLHVLDLTALRRRVWVKRGHRLLVNKYYLDYVAEELIVRRGFHAGVARLTDLVDRLGVDRAVDAVWRGTFALGRWGRLAQSGQVQLMGVALFAGALIIFGAVVIF